MRLSRKICIAVAVIAVLGFSVWYKLFRHAPSRYSDAVEHFKYGSIGGEGATGIPYWIWLVLPRIFPDKLPGPGGYAALGASWETGKAVPVGFTYEVIGFPRVATNCAACHVASVRIDANGPRALYMGAPASRFRVQDYARFLISCAKDSQFNADRIMREILLLYDMPLVDRLMYRYLVIPFTKRTLVRSESEDFYWMASRPDWGPGRLDMNPFQLQVLKLPDDGAVGSTDMMAIWNQEAHTGFLRHSDGLNPSLTEAVRSAGLATGATKKSIDIKSLDRIENLLLKMRPPRFPYTIDAALAERGRSVFERECAGCHSPGGGWTGKVVPLAEIGTDPHRVRHWRQAAADGLNRFAAGESWAFQQFRKTDGYVALLLDGIWLRAPYLHNGSVPALADLLEPVSMRPAVFYRGYDVYDPVKLGFVSSGPQAEAEGFRFDTAVPGNGNGGHEYGTSLPAGEKHALVELMKTL
jgi:mono/diheme cytochrome c family protein